MSELTPPQRLHLGISQCLLGERVRYDGDHQYTPLCAEVMQPHVQFRPICPEMAIGLGSPRPPVRLCRQNDGRLHAIGKHDATLDISTPLQALAAQMAEQLQSLDGYILMPRSPSCGLGSSKVYSAAGQLQSDRGNGLFAQALIKLQPLLPVIEVSQLQRPGVALHFLWRAQAWQEWRQLQRAALNTAQLDTAPLWRFHRRHSLLLLAQHRHLPAQLARLLQCLSQAISPLRADHYGQHFMRALAQQADTVQLSRALAAMASHLDGPAAAEWRHIVQSLQTQNMSRPQALLHCRQLLIQYPHRLLQQQSLLGALPTALLQDLAQWEQRRMPSKSY